MKNFLGININKNLAKKGLIIALALAAVIGMSYFGSQEYLNQSIMDMLMGDCGGACDCLQAKHQDCQGASCTYTCKNLRLPHSLDLTGPANGSSTKSYVCSGDPYQIRYYNCEGKCYKDKDYHTSEPWTPHYHYFSTPGDGTTRGPAQEN